MEQVDPDISSTPLMTKYGEFNLYVFSWSANEQDNVLVLENLKPDLVPFVRVQSACYTGEIFESLDCDCHWQLETSLKIVAKERGLLIYMLCDGRGAGLLTKIRGMRLTAEEGIDTADAYRKLGTPLDPRTYERVAHILKHFRIAKVKLLTNNPRKIEGLSKASVFVEHLPLESTPTSQNQSYLKAKKNKLGHLFSKL